MGDLKNLLYLRHINRTTNEDIVQYHVASEIIARPGYNTNGKDVNIQLNAYPISQFPTKPVYQYDVSPSHKVSGRWTGDILTMLSGPRRKWRREAHRGRKGLEVEYSKAKSRQPVHLRRE